MSSGFSHSVLSSSDYDGVVLAKSLGQPTDGVATHFFTLGNDPDEILHVIDVIQAEISSGDQRSILAISVALTEALSNSIFHGNLELSSRLREEERDLYHLLAEERRLIEPYCDRKVYLSASVTTRRATFVAQDEGPGFDILALADPLDDENIAKPSGRGVLMIRHYMDQVEFNSTGNRITMSRALQPSVDRH